MGRCIKVKGGRHQADAPFRTCQVQKTGYFFFAAFFFVAFFFAAFFLAAIRESPPPDLLLGCVLRTTVTSARSVFLTGASRDMLSARDVPERVTVTRQRSYQIAAKHFNYYVQMNSGRASALNELWINQLSVNKLAHYDESKTHLAVIQRDALLCPVRCRRQVT
jgi:hypothetical protein